MNYITTFVVFVIVVVIAASVISGVLIVGVLAVREKRTQAGSDEEPQQRKILLTVNEQEMYNRLTQALPKLVVLAQVSFGSLLYTKSRAARHTFKRKIADFVVCDRAFQVLAIIEFDDGNHDGKEEQDASRGALLTGAGHRVLRYRGIPGIEQVRKDF